MFIIFLIILTLAILLEGTVTTLPLVFLCLLCFAIIIQDWRIFPLAFGAGILLDMFAVRPVGSASMFFLILFFLLLLYQRKYEITSMPFVGIAAFIGSGLFLTIFEARDMLLQAQRPKLWLPKPLI